MKELILFGLNLLHYPEPVVMAAVQQYAVVLFLLCRACGMSHIHYSMHSAGPATEGEDGVPCPCSERN